MTEVAISAHGMNGKARGRDSLAISVNPETPSPI
jgi:hypothetical protein